MKLNKSISALAAAAALGFSGHSAAAPTQAGETISNSVTLSYTIGGTPTTPPAITADFIVDRKVDMEISLKSTAVVSTELDDGSNSTTVVYNYDLTNSGNLAQDFAISLADTAAQAITGATDNKDFTPALGTNYNVYTSDPTLSPKPAPVASGVLNIAADTNLVTPTSTTQDFWIEVQIPSSGFDNDDVVVFETLATASNSAGAAIAGQNATNKNTSANLAQPLIVFADDPDASGDANTAFNGKVSVFTAIEFAVGDFTDPNGNNPGDTGYSGPYLKAVVINDPICEGAAVTTASTDKSASGCVSGYGTPKAIPGALVEFTFTATNSGAGQVKGLSITETLDTEFVADSMTYVANSAQKGVPTNMVTITPAPTVTGNTITVNFGDLAGSDDNGSPDNDTDDIYTSVIVKYRGLLQ
jgi:hypothetical protein